MSEITDVMAFAAGHPDYWQELFSGESPLPEELTQEERAAVEVAAKHIDALTVELLHSAADRFAAKVGEVGRKRHRESATLRKRASSLYAPKGLEDRLYYICFGLEHNRGSGHIELYGALTVKKRALDTLKAALDVGDIEYYMDDYWVYPGYIELKEGARVNDLAERVAAETYRLFEVLKGL